MAEDRIDSIVGAKAYKQLDDLTAKLELSQRALVDNIDAAIKLNGVLGNSKSLSDLEKNNVNAAKAVENLNKVQAQTLLIETKIEAERQKIQIKQDARDAKAAKRRQTIISNSQAEIDAANKSAQGEIALGLAINETNKRRAEEANAATAATAATKFNAEATAKSNLTKKQQNFLLAEEKLNLERNTRELKNQVREANAVKGSLEQRRAALIRLNAVYDNQSPIERSTASGKRLQNIIGGLTTQVYTLEKTTGRSQRNVGNYGSALGKVWGGLRNIAMFLPGIGLAGLLGLAIEPLYNLIKGLDIFKVKLSQSAMAGKTLSEALGGAEYKNAVKNVNELTTNIDLAKKGFISKEGVLKQYNETIGLTLGQVSSLDEAEKALTKNAPAYIQAMLLKSAAQLALDKSAQKQLEAAQAALKTDKEALGVIDNYLFSNPKLRKVREQAANTQRRKEIRAATEESNQLLKIFEEFQAKATEITKNFKGGFFGSAAEDEKSAADTLKKQKAFEKQLLNFLQDAAKYQESERAKAEKKRQEATGQEFDRILKEYFDNGKDQIELLKKLNEEKQLLYQQDADASLIELAREYSVGEKDAQEYADGRLIIQRKLTQDLINTDIAGLQAIIDKQKSYGFDTTDTEIKLAELKQRLSKETTNAQIEDLEKLAEREAEIKEKRKEFAREVGNLAIALVEANFARQEEALKVEAEQIDIRKERDIEAVDRSLASEEDKANRIAIINARAQGQKDALERKQRQLDLERARFDRAAAIAKIIVETASAVAQALPNIPLSILVGAIGAAQLATAVAAPLPKFKEGGEMQYTGLAEYGHGTELRIDPDGAMSFTKSTPEIGLVQKGTQFVSNPELIKMLAKPDPIQWAGGMAIDLNKVVEATENSGKRVEKAIAGLRQKQGGLNYYSTSKGREYLKRNL